MPLALLGISIRNRIDTEYPMAGGAQLGPHPIPPVAVVGNRAGERSLHHRCKSYVGGRWQTTHVRSRWPGSQHRARSADWDCAAVSSGITTSPGSAISSFMECSLK